MIPYTPLAMTTVLVAVGGAEATRLSKKEPLGMSPVIGGFALGIFLFALGMITEDLASKLCLLIIVAALLKNGKALVSLIPQGK